MSERDELKKAIAELDEWVAGRATFWNQMHGSVTGDYDNQILNTANADNAQKNALAAKVMGLGILVAFNDDE